MVYFVSGHRDITEEEFQKHYESILWEAIMEDAEFVVGDCQGVDDMAQKYLKTLSAKKITVYHMFEEPKHNCGGTELKGGYTSNVSRDFAMTLNSDKDIAWVRKGKERSGTQQNIDRRKWMNDRKSKGLSYTFKDFKNK